VAAVSAELVAPPPHPPRKRWPQRALITALAIATFALGWIGGRATAPAPESAALDCQDAHDTYATNLEQGGDLLAASQDYSNPNRTSDRAQATQRATVAMHAVIQNPDCFTATQRAEAQALLDLMSP
jgi:hypothetical protein